MKKYNLENVKDFLKIARPEISKEDTETIAISTFNYIENNLINLDKLSEIEINEWLWQQHQYSAYNLVKDVFRENLPEEYGEYILTPIFHELIDEILNNCVREKLVENNEQVLSDIVFYNPNIRRLVLKIILKSINC